MASSTAGGPGRSARNGIAWGDRYYSPAGPRRILLHAADEGTLDEMGRCNGCGEFIAPADTVITPGPGIAGEPPLENLLAAAFREPRRVLSPIRPEPA